MEVIIKLGSAVGLILKFGTGLIRLALSSAIAEKKLLKVLAMRIGSVMRSPLRLIELIFCLFFGYLSTSFKIDQVFKKVLAVDIKFLCIEHFFTHPYSTVINVAIMFKFVPNIY
jgi:hypothetical protein